MITLDNVVCVVKREDAENNNQWKKHTSFSTSIPTGRPITNLRGMFKGCNVFYLDVPLVLADKVRFQVMSSSKLDQLLGGEYYWVLSIDTKLMHEKRKLLETIFPTIIKREIKKEVVYEATNRRPMFNMRIVGRLGQSDMIKLISKIDGSVTKDFYGRVSDNDLNHFVLTRNYNIGFVSGFNENYDMVLWSNSKELKTERIPRKLQLLLDKCGSFIKHITPVYEVVKRKLVTMEVGGTQTKMELVGYQYMNDDGIGPFFTENQKESQRYLANWPVFRLPRGHDCTLGQGMAYGQCGKCKSEGLYNESKDLEKRIVYLRESL